MNEFTEDAADESTLKKMNELLEEGRSRQRDDSNGVVVNHNRTGFSIRLIREFDIRGLEKPTKKDAWIYFMFHNRQTWDATLLLIGID